MEQYFYQIKVGEFKGPDNFQYNPPLFNGVVEAESNDIALELARKKVVGDVSVGSGLKFHSSPFTIWVQPLKKASYPIRRLFENRVCVNCENEFTLSDKLNIGCKFFNEEVCSDECSTAVYTMRKEERDNVGVRSTTIYKILNKKDNLVYIGKTTKHFTSRWHDHFFQHTSPKLLLAIKASKITDWNFEVIEIIDTKEYPKFTKKELDDYVLERESFWINHYNAISNGYNSMVSKKLKKQVV